MVDNLQGKECERTSDVCKRPLSFRGIARYIQKQKKLIFDEEVFQKEEKCPKTKAREDVKSTESLDVSDEEKSTEAIWAHFCDWYPVLFGIDEEEIPFSDYEEGVFDYGYDWDWDDDDEKISPEENVDLGRKPLGIPKYGRRARLKPKLRRGDEEFECVCDIDKNYSRHYVPHFGGGISKEGEELKTPHFRAFWETYKEQAHMEESDRWSKIFDTTTEEVDEQKGVLYRPTPKFPGSSKNDIKKMREEILTSFRPLDCREVRRYRIPYAEALYLELQEDLYLEYAPFFKFLIIKDYFVHQTPESGPCLRDNRLMLNRVVAFVKLAERFSRRQEFHKEALVLLRSGKYFNDHDSNWWWLAEEFYTKAVKVSRNSVIDGGKAEAISNYILGTFLLDCVHRVQPAQENLLKARELSMGKDWTANKILLKKQDPVYKECANYLCRALIAVSQELRNLGKPEEALPHIRRSHKLCQESKTSRWDIEMETYFELGRTYQEVGFLDWAKTAFRKFIEIALVHNCTKRVCDGYLELAICCRSENNMDCCHRNLWNYLKTAETKEDKNLVAFGNRYLGEFFLNNGNSKLAAEYFKKAFYSFHQQCTDVSKLPFEGWQTEHFTLLHDVELTRVLVGLAEGEQLTKPICQLILEAKDKKNQQKILQLINWKNNREKMFSLEATTYEEIPEIVEESELQLPFVTVPKTEVVPEMKTSKETEEEAEDMRTVRFAL